MALIASAMDKVPEQAKLVGDGAALLTSIAAIAGQLTTIIGLIGVIASTAWALLRLYNEYKKTKGK